jgi:lipopolysaccharide export system permease protein
MEKIIFRKLILDISLRALIITFTIGLIVWIIQAVNHLDFVINDGHNFSIYFYYNLYNFPKIIHRIIPFVFAISIFFELIKYEKNNELLIFWTNGITKKKFVLSLVNFAVIVMFLQIVMGSLISPNSQLKARTFLKNSNMDFLPNLIKQGKFIDIVSGLTIFISEKTEVNSFKNIYIQEGDSFSLEKSDNQIIFAKEGYLVDGNKKLFRLLNGKIVSINNDKRLVSFEFDKIDYDLSSFTSKTIKVAKIQELPSYKILQCSLNLMNDKTYIDKMFNCEKSRLKNLNQEIYKRFIKPIYIPLLTLVCCFLITFSKVQNNFTIKTIKIFLYLLIVIILSETLMRYVGETRIFLIILISLPILLFFTIFNFLESKM